MYRKFYKRCHFKDKSGEICTHVNIMLLYYTRGNAILRQQYFEVEMIKSYAMFIRASILQCCVIYVVFQTGMAVHC